MSIDAHWVDKSQAFHGEGDTWHSDFFQLDTLSLLLPYIDKYKEKLVILQSIGITVIKSKETPISWCAPNKLFVENLLTSTLCIHSFSAYYTVL